MATRIEQSHPQALACRQEHSWQAEDTPHSDGQALDLTQRHSSLAGVTELASHSLRDPGLIALDVLQQLHLVEAVEGRLAHQQLKQNGPHTPQVRLSVILVELQAGSVQQLSHLWTTGRQCRATGQLDVRQDRRQVGDRHIEQASAASQEETGTWAHKLQV